MNFEYRIIRSSWGIYVRLEGEFVVGERTSEDSRVVAANGFFAVKLIPELPSLGPEEVDAVHRGLEILQTLVCPSARKQEVLVLQKFVKNPCDYQAEGLGMAILGAFCERFSCACPVVPVAFVKDENRYHFDWSGVTYG